MFQTSYTFGRFNIPHYGHLQLIAEMSSFSQKTVVGVSTGKGNLPVELRIQFLQKLLPAFLKDKVQFVPTNSAFGLKEFVAEGNNIGVFGQDQSSFAEVVAKHYQGETWVLPRNPAAPSSSACRRAFEDNDIASLVELMPTNLIEVAYDLYLAEKGV